MEAILQPKFLDQVVGEKGHSDQTEHVQGKSPADPGLLALEEEIVPNVKTEGEHP